MHILGRCGAGAHPRVKRLHQKWSGRINLIDSQNAGAECLTSSRSHFFLGNSSLDSFLFSSLLFLHFPGHVKQLPILLLLQMLLIRTIPPGEPSGGRSAGWAKKNAWLRGKPKLRADTPCGRCGLPRFSGLHIAGTTACHANVGLHTKPSLLGEAIPDRFAFLG